jgi:hypothetical protein
MAIFSIQDSFRYRRLISLAWHIPTGDSEIPPLRKVASSHCVAVQQYELLEMNAELRSFSGNLFGKHGRKSMRPHLFVEDADGRQVFFT